MMKKFLSYAFLSAIAFTSTLGFSACSSNDDVIAEPNPNYDPKTGEVSVDFVFNVSTGNEPYTRMSAANVQASSSEAFRGINNAYLGIFKLASDGNSVPKAILADKIHSFGTVISANQLSQDENDDKPSSRRVLELSLPTETNALMFWGKAIKTGSDADQGKITTNVSEDLSQTSFSMCKIVPVTADPTSPHISQSSFAQHEKLMAAVLTQIVRSAIENQTITFDGASRNVSSLAWSDFVDVKGESAGYTLHERTTSPLDASLPMCALGEKLSKAFVTFNTIRSNELRAGAGEAVAYVIHDLMGIINSVSGSTPASLQEKVAQAVSDKIKENVEKFFDPDHEYKWKSVSTILSNITIEGVDDVTDACDLNNFPMTFNLPWGSVLLQFDITVDSSQGFLFTYNYKGAVETYAMGGSTTSESAFDPMNYVYPAELCYFGNSPIRVTDVSKVANDYPDGVAKWESDASWGSDWTANSHVQSTTRSVAMQDNINYGTALLETHVRYGAGTLEDNNHNLQWEWNKTDEPNNEITVTSNDDHFHLTGVLIGGQEPEVGWNYIAKSSSPGFGHMVYDKVKSKLSGNGEVDYIQIPAYSTASGMGPLSQANYTLVWDNWEAANLGKKQRDVYIALEFENNSKDFYGENNLIRTGSRFYLVGKLNPDEMPSGLKKADNTAYTQAEFEADRSLGITWPSCYALPPYDSDGYTIKERRVFIQDFKTVANFVISKTSLQHALVSVPNLRSGQISLGLSVDIVWQTGLKYSDVILGQ